MLLPKKIYEFNRCERSATGAGHTDFFCARVARYLIASAL